MIRRSPKVEGSRGATRADDIPSSFITRRPGSVESAVRRAEFPFDRLVGSWNAEVSEGAWVEMQIQVFSGKQRSLWMRMPRWKLDQAESLSREYPGWGRISEDTLMLAPRKADAYRYRLVFSEGVRVHRAAVSCMDSSASRPKSKEFAHGPWVRELEIAPRSQMMEDQSIRLRICSPTSLSMVSSFWGVDVPTAAMAALVRDHASDTPYGNWTLNIAAAGTLGFLGEFAWLDSLDDVQNDIAQGRPVICTVSFNEGELRGAPIPKTAGHLLVAAGFTESGDVIAFDPAAPTVESVRRVYDRGEFDKAWSNRGNAAYRIWPRT